MMRTIFQHVVTCLFLALPLAVKAAPESFAPVVEPLMPAVVNISTTQKVVTPQGGVPFDIPGMDDDNPQSEQFKELFRQFGERFGGGELERDVTSLGSGFVIDPDGYVVTNNHVIGNATDITVIFSDNTHLPATVVGHDTKTDLALIKVKPGKKLAFVNFGDSDALKVGDWLIAVGNPFGLGGSVSAGIVSARGRNINAGPFDDFIQTDAAINRGNSGGPLFNARGEVVGINSAIFSPTGTNIGIGFAVPTSLAKPVLDQLRKSGHVQRAWLGVKIQEVNEEIANSLGMKTASGALLLDITPKSPAAGSDLQPGDVILKFDGRDIKEMRNLPRLVAETPANKNVEILVFRKGREMRTHVKLAEQKDDADVAPGPAKLGGAGKGPVKGEGRILGMELMPIDAAARAQFDLPKEVRGLLVTQLDRSSEIAKQGVQPGDVVLDVNQNPVNSTAEVKAQLDAVKKSGRGFVLIRMQRGRAVQFITVPVK